MSSREMKVLVDSMKSENSRIQFQIREMAINQANALLQGMVIDSIIKSNDRSLNYYDHAIISFRTFYSEIFAKCARLISNDRSMDSYLVEIYKKYSIPVACIIFVLLGAPLGIMTKKGGFGVGASLSLGFFLLYWSCLIGGEKLSDRDLVSPFLGMWIANIILGILGFYLVTKVVRESPGLSFEMLQKLLPKKYRKKIDSVGSGD